MKTEPTRRQFIKTSAVAGLLLPLQAIASEAKKPKRVKLFNGKNLEGWDVITCKAVVDKGTILLEEGNGLVQTKKQYSDFILEFEWKMLDEKFWDSGIYFRYLEVPEGRPWPKRYQVNLRKGMEGNVGGIEGAESEGLIKVARWNKFKLTVKGDALEMMINGKPAWKGKGLEGSKKGFIALQAEVPGGGKHRFKNIYITEL